MRLFVSEYVCGGAWADEALTGSLAAEGQAMLAAFVADAARVPGVNVVTTWDTRLGAPPWDDVEVNVVASPADERRTFQRLSAECDATCVIAPEFDGILAERCRIVEEVRGHLLGPSSAAVELCADKWRLARHLEAAGIRTLETNFFDFDRDAFALDFPFPAVIKPRDGAGSQGMYLLRTRSDFESLRNEMSNEPLLRKAIWQPFVAGAAVSVALLVDSGGRTETLPVCEQRLSDDGRFRYLGGRIPARVRDSTEIRRTARLACETISGLWGYMGVDLIAPLDAAFPPIVVEINPRLTTSYLGYRRLTAENLASRILFPGRATDGMRFGPGSVTFAAGATPV